MSCYQLHETRRRVSVELIGDEDPRGLRVRLDTVIDVGHKIFLYVGRSDRGFHDLTGGDVKIRDLAQCAMAHVLELDTFNQPGPASRRASAPGPECLFSHRCW